MQGPPPCKHASCPLDETVATAWSSELHVIARTVTALPAESRADTERRLICPTRSVSRWCSIAIDAIGAEVTVMVELADWPTEFTAITGVPAATARTTLWKGNRSWCSMPRMPAREQMAHTPVDVRGARNRRGT